MDVFFGSGLSVGGFRSWAKPILGGWLMYVAQVEEAAICSGAQLSVVVTAEISPLHVFWWLCFLS